MAFTYLLDLFRQVTGILQPAHGGTGSRYGEGRTVVKGTNATGASLPLYTLVEFKGGANDTRLQKVTAINSNATLGPVVGYYDGLKLVEAACPDGYEAAVQVAGIPCRVLIESTVTRGDFAFAAATDGTMYSASAAGVGAFGRIIDSADVANGDTYARVHFLTADPSAGGSTSFAAPALTLGTSNAAGAASTAIRTDATIAAFDATVPVTQAFSDAAATGSAGVAARRDHKHGMPASGVPAFATPAVVLGTAAAAGAAGTVIRSDSTIVAFDATTPANVGTAATGSAAVAARRDHVHATGAGTPSTQAFSDAAATGTGPAAAMTDHKHAMPALGTGSTNAAAGNHTHGAAGGGAWDGVVVKAADEDVASSTTLQNDDELFTPTLVNGGYYQFEAIVFMSSPVGGSAPDLKFSFGEDNTFRGYLMRVAGNAGTGVSELVTGSVQQNQALSSQTGTTAFGVFVWGSWVSGGGVMRLMWAQNTSGGNATRVHAGSTLKYKRLA